MNGWTCDPEQPCTVHECHEYPDGRHHFDLHGHAPGARVCICGTLATERASIDQYGDLTCPCGNQAHLDGFVTARADGTLASPRADGEWDNVHLVCWRCYRILDQNSGAVSGVAPLLSDKLPACLHDEHPGENWCGLCGRSLAPEEASA